MRGRREIRMGGEKARGCQKKWEDSWDECKKLKELEVRFPSPLTLLIDPTIYQSLRATTFHPNAIPLHDFLPPRNSISFSNPWKAVFITSSRLAKAVRLLDVSSRLFSAKYVQVYIGICLFA
jgi:hypothetical protein